MLSWAGGTERWRDQAALAAQLVKDPSLAFVPADAKAAWTREPGRARAGYANIAEFLRKYSEAGGKVLAATDTGCCTQIIPGLSLHYEMQMLTDLGIPPMKAIQGATLWAAEVIGQEKDLGSIEPGKLADFTVIEGNPLADIGATKNVRMVIKDGQVMDTAYDPKWVNPILFCAVCHKGWDGQQELGVGRAQTALLHRRSWRWPRGHCPVLPASHRFRQRQITQRGEVSYEQASVATRNTPALCFGAVGIPGHWPTHDDDDEAPHSGVYARSDFGSPQSAPFPTARSSRSGIPAS